MAKITPEEQAKVDEILLEAKGLYAAILYVKPPQSLGLAIRDGKPWDALGEADTIALFSVIVALRKAAMQASTAPPAEAAPAPVSAPKPNGKEATSAAGAPKKDPKKEGSEAPKTGP